MRSVWVRRGNTTSLLMAITLSNDPEAECQKSKHLFVSMSSCSASYPNHKVQSLFSFQLSALHSSLLSSSVPTSNKHDMPKRDPLTLSSGAFGVVGVLVTCLGQGDEADGILQQIDPQKKRTKSWRYQHSTGKCPIPSNPPLLMTEWPTISTSQVITILFHFYGIEYGNTMASHGIPWDAQHVTCVVKPQPSRSMRTTMLVGKILGGKGFQTWWKSLFQLIGNLVENVGMGHAAFLKHSVISVLLRIRRRTTCQVHSKQEKMRPSFTFWLRFVPFTLQLFVLGRGSCWGSASTEKSNFEPNPHHMAPNLLSAEVATGSLRPKCSRYQRYIRQPWSERNLNGYHSVAPQIRYIDCRWKTIEIVNHDQIKCYSSTTSMKDLACFTSEKWWTKLLSS